MRCSTLCKLKVTTSGSHTVTGIELAVRRYTGFPESNCVYQFQGPGDTPYVRNWRLYVRHDVHTLYKGSHCLDAWRCRLTPLVFENAWIPGQSAWKMMEIFFIGPWSDINIYFPRIYWQTNKQRRIGAITGNFSTSRYPYLIERWIADTPSKKRSRQPEKRICLDGKMNWR